MEGLIFGILRYATFFFKLCSSKTMANKSKDTFSLIRSRLFLLAIIYNGLWQLWLVLAGHFSERAVSSLELPGISDASL